MAINEKQLTELNAGYLAIKGQEPSKFVCPITLRDDSEAELCDGHILNESIKKASRQTIIQRKDVDNYFGRTIEPDLITMLNIPVATPKELVRNARDLSITEPGGDKISAFFGDEKARDKFQQIKLTNKDGSLFAAPFLKDGVLENKLYEDLEVEWTMTVTNSAVTGSFLKSGYLALFKMLGYVWVFHADGDKVRRALASFYNDRATKKQAIKYFYEFEGSVAFLNGQGIDELGDTLRNGSLLLHFVNDNFLFAVTCLFRINDATATVTLPCYEKEGYYFDAFNYYQVFLKDSMMRQNVYFARYTNKTFEVSRQPLRWRGRVK